MTALLIDIQPGDEVIMPSFTFVSTANAFALRGAKIVFIDIRPDTLNMDESKIESAITDKTKAIVPVHYAGVGCEMDEILRIAQKYNLYVIEDSAQGLMSTYKNKALGTVAHFGCYSFHETKNIHCGEGGALLVNEPSFIRRAEIILEKGTNRREFLRGEVDKYTWKDIGSSYLISELNSSFLLAQFENADRLTQKRIKLWKRYQDNLVDLATIGLPQIPDTCRHNAHIFYVIMPNREMQSGLIDFLRQKQIQATFHFVPLHSTETGKRFGRFEGEDRFTTDMSQRIVRLPLYYDLSLEDVDYICEMVKEFVHGV